MNTISIQVSYRPIRVGWCVEEGDRGGLERVLRLTHCLWGGRFNPIIPVGEPRAAAQLVDLFRVDVLFQGSPSENVKTFIDSHSHLPWPFFGKALVEETYAGKCPILVDVRGALARLVEDDSRRRNPRSWRPVQPTWQPEDPLALVMFATFGGYSAPAAVGVDYRREFALLPGSTEIGLELSVPIPPQALAWITPSRVTEVGLSWRGGESWERSGLYLGGANNFADVVNYWNLRAAGINVVFLDREHSARLEPLTRAFCEDLYANPGGYFRGLPEGSMTVWSQAESGSEMPGFVSNPILCRVEQATWNGLNIKPVSTDFGGRWCLGMVDDAGGTPSVTLQLPKFSTAGAGRSQALVVSLAPAHDLPGTSGFTLSFPFLPGLNEFFGREAHFSWNCARAEPDGLGVIDIASLEHLTIRALEVSRLFGEVFKLAGIDARLSAAGRIASRVIGQMGGLQGCRPFKIRGVRKLLQKYSAQDSFTRGAAVLEIGMVDPATKALQFAEYEHLVIERGGPAKLTPSVVFDYLCKRGVFRVGLEFKCPACGQRFWCHLDNAKISIACDYCGNGMDVTEQLRDRDWRFRRSGLFGRDNNQEGAIPVLLLLQQLDTLLHNSHMVFSTALELRPGSGQGPTCETDFAVLVSRHDGAVELAIGECKAAGNIDRQDVENLTRVAAAFPYRRVQTFVLFVKTGRFSDAEVALCREGRDQYRPNVVLLSDRELEPYFAYERAAKDFEIRQHAGSFQDMAQITDDLYFSPKPRARATSEETRWG